MITNALYYVAVLFVPALFAVALPSAWRRVLGLLAAVAALVLMFVVAPSVGAGIGTSLAMGAAIGAAAGELIDFRRARSAKRGWLHG